MRLEYRILGPLEVRRGTDVVPLASGNQRKVLLVLALEPNRSVSRERLIDALWGERPPARAKNALQVHVSALRDLLEVGVDRGAVLATTPTGYQLNAPEETIDSRRFERLAASPMRSRSTAPRARHWSRRSESSPGPRCRRSNGRSSCRTRASRRRAPPSAGSSCRLRRHRCWGASAS